MNWNLIIGILFHDQIVLIFVSKEALLDMGFKLRVGNSPI